MLKSGKLANAIKEMRQARLYVLGLTEVRWEDGGDFVSDGVRVIYAGEDESQRGVAVLLDKTAAKMCYKRGASQRPTVSGESACQSTGYCSYTSLHAYYCSHR